jgi:hypothetical protein
MELSEGVDEETWLFHLRRGDYSNWFDSVIKDNELAAFALEIEQDTRQSAVESRSQMRNAIENRYAAPA